MLHTHQTDNPDIKQVYELHPDDGRQSFYGKAIVIVTNDCKQHLKSYDTLVCYKDITGKVHRLWDSWSLTTGIHIKAFCGLNKKEFESLPVEEVK